MTDRKTPFEYIRDPDALRERIVGGIETEGIRARLYAIVDEALKHENCQFNVETKTERTPVHDLTLETIFTLRWKRELE